MVNFVEQSACEEIAGFEADLAAILELGFNFDPAGAFNETIDFGHGKTTFIVTGGFMGVGLDDFGVNQGGEVGVVFIVKIVTHDNDATVDADLGRGESSRELVWMRSFPFKREANHVANYIMDFVIDGADLGRGLAQSGVGGSDNFSHNI